MYIYTKQTNIKAAMLTQVTNEGLTYCILICIRFCFCFTVKPQLYNYITKVCLGS